MKYSITFMLCLVAALSAQAFDFSALAPTGQRLYYTITASETVSLVAPSDYSWGNYDQPEGGLVIPSTVTHNNTDYTVTEIDRMALSQCNGLLSVTIPGSVKTIGLRAFANDTALTTATLQEGVQRIDMMAFVGCKSLANISLPSTMTRIAASVFEGTAYYDDSTHWNSHYTLTLDNWVIMEGNYFEDTVRIVEGIIGLANNSFLNCNKIPKVILPSTLKYMGDATFRECASLDTVQLHATTPPTLSASTFEGLYSITVLVPCETSTDYLATAIWQDMEIMEMPCDTSDTTTIVDTIVPINPWPGHPVIGIAEVSNQTLTVTPSTTGIVVHGAQQGVLRVYDMMGYLVAQVAHATEHQEIPLPASGIYILLPEDGRAIKINYCR